MIIPSNLNLRNGFFLILLTLLCLELTGCSKNQIDIYETMQSEEIYDRGKNHILETAYEKAIDDFEELEARFPFGSLHEKGQLAIIYAYIKKDENIQAVAAAERFISMYPNHEHIDYVYYLKGLAHFHAMYTFIYKKLPINRALRDPQEAKDAFIEFKHLLQYYPNSKYLPDAKQRMIFLKNYLATYHFYVGNYYFNRKAYLSAANRYVYILENFNDTTVIPEALLTMVKSYRFLKMDALADDAEQVLFDNYPEKVKKS